MRFNKTELEALAVQPSHRFDREGVLYLREKQDGFFRRAEGADTRTCVKKSPGLSCVGPTTKGQTRQRIYRKWIPILYTFGRKMCLLTMVKSLPTGCESPFERRLTSVLQGRWCRLRGNLLFYLRSAEPWSESAGLFVLEHCTISPEPPDPNGLWPFVIVFHGGASQRLAATSESERAMWLLSLQTASYDCMRAQLQALQQRLEECRGPMPALDLDMWRLQRGHTIDLAEAPLCEASLACDNLLCDGHGRPPSACVEVHVRAFSSPTPAWVKYARTEVVERSSNPCFLATVSFRATDGLGPTSAMRFTVYDVCERISNTATPLGSATIVLGAIQDSARVRVALRGPGGGASGFLTVSGCTPEPEPRPPGSPARSAPTANGHANGVIESVGSPVFMTHRRSQSLPPRLGVKLRVPSQGPLQALFTAPHIQTYRLHSGLGGDICVMEIMAESRVCYTIPQQLLSIWMQREKELLQEISAMGELGGAWRGPQMQLLDRHLHLLRQYSQAKQSLQAQSSKGSHFKASSRKGDPSLEFAAVNLHLQRMWAHNDTLNRSGVSDIITVGAFTAHCGPTKSGGLIRLVQQSKLCPDKDLDHTCKVDAANDAIQAIKQLRRELVDCMTQLMALARARKSVGMMPLCEDMVRRSKSLLTIWDAGLVEEAFRFLEAHRATPDDSGFSEDHSLDMSPFKRIAQQLGSLELKSPDLEDFATPCSPNQPMDWPQPFPVANDASFSSLSFSETHFDVNGTVSNGGQPLSLNVSLNNSNNSSFVDSVLESPGANYYRPSEEPEPWDLTQLNIEASVMCLVSKVKFLCGRCGSPAVRLRQPREALRGSLKAPLISTALTNGSDKPKEVTTTPTLKHIAARGNKFTDGLDLSTTGDWAGELRPSMRKLRQATDGLLKTARLTHSVFRLQQNAREARRAAALQLRRDVCFSQALTALISGLCARLWGGPVDPQFLCLISSPTGNPVGPLACFEGLLSLHGGEADMWGDMCVAVEDLAVVTFTLQRSQLPLNKSALPQVIGTRGALTVLLPAPDHVMTCKHISSFRVTPVFFNIGINEMATLAEALGQSAPQRRSNLDSLGRLMTYHQQYQRAMGPSPALHNLVENLRRSIHSATGKNVEVLHLASDVTRRMQGIRFTSCKSAKDRTGMSVTLEQCRILVQDYHLSAQELPKALDAMRSEGCRRENTMKNTGVRRYAFNSLQVVALPPKYRPPAGTYGSAQT